MLYQYKAGMNKNSIREDVIIPTEANVGTGIDRDITINVSEYGGIWKISLRMNDDLAGLDQLR